MIHKFSKNEITDIIITIFLISIFFSVNMTNRISWTTENFKHIIILTLIIFTLTFLIRIYAQKSIARKYHHHIEYHKWGYGLLFGLVTMLLGIQVITPGYFSNKLYDKMATDDEKAKISLTGPIVNIILAVVFIICILVVKPSATLTVFNVNGLILLAALIGFTINTYMAVFNLVPFMLLEGVAIFNWDIKYWLCPMIISVILLIINITHVLI